MSSQDKNLPYEILTLSHLGFKYCSVCSGTKQGNYSIYENIRDYLAKEYVKASSVPLPDASTCKSILHRFGYNNETARDPHKKNLRYADGVLPGSGSPDHHSTATLEVSPPPTHSVGNR